MKVACFVALCTVATVHSAFAQLIPGWIQDHTDQWYAAFNAGDATAMGRLYSPDAVLTLQGEMYEGRVAIEAFHRDNFAQAKFECTFKILGATIVDRVAAVWGEDTCVDTPKGAGKVGNWQGHWMTVYQLQPNGNWMIVRDSAEDARPSTAGR